MVEEAERAVAELEQRILAGDESASDDDLAELLVKAEAKARFADLSLQGFRRREAARELADRDAAARQLAEDVKAHGSSGALVGAGKTAKAAVDRAVRKYLDVMNTVSVQASELIQRAEQLGIHDQTRVESVYRMYPGGAVQVEDRDEAHWGADVVSSATRQRLLDELFQAVQQSLPHPL